MMISPTSRVSLSLSLSWIPCIIHAVFCVVPSARLTTHMHHTALPLALAFTFPNQHVYIRALHYDVHDYILRVYKCLYYFDWSWQDTIDQISSRPEDHEEGMRTPCALWDFTFFFLSFFFFFFKKHTFHFYSGKRKGQTNWFFNHKCLNVFQKNWVMRWLHLIFLCFFF